MLPDHLDQPVGGALPAKGFQMRQPNLCQMTANDLVQKFSEIYHNVTRHADPRRIEEIQTKGQVQAFLLIHADVGQAVPVAS